MSKEIQRESASARLANAPRSTGRDKYTATQMEKRTVGDLFRLVKEPSLKGRLVFWSRKGRGLVVL